MNRVQETMGATFRMEGQITSRLSNSRFLSLFSNTTLVLTATNELIATARNMQARELVEFFLIDASKVLVL